MDPDPKQIIARGEFSLFATQLRHDSIIVIEVPHRLTKDGREELQSMMRGLFPTHRRVILDAGMTCRVIHPAEAPEELEEG